VAKLDPDILNLCEVEGIDELNLLQSSVESKYAAYLKPGTDTATGQNVGLLTKFAPKKNLTRTEDRMTYPLAGSKCGYTGAEGEVGVSKHYITEFELYGRPVLFIALHLLAYPEDALRCAEREAQAQIIHNYIAEYLGTMGGDVILLGDFNDFDREVLDANRNVPISRVLDILKGTEGGYAIDFSEQNGAYRSYLNDYELISVSQKMPEVERFSDWWDSNEDCVSTANEFSMIDHVLVTPFLYDKIANVFVYHGYDEFCGKYDSDHYPVVVDFL
jgi:exonuclease III